MASYGRNFEFRIPPVHGQRSGRFVIPSDATAGIVIGAPVKWITTDDAIDGRLPVELATGAQAPTKGTSGILVYELDPGIGLGGVDPLLTTYSDFDTAPVGRAVQVVSGDQQVKVVFRNTEDRTFLNTREYAGRTMVAGTPAVGDLLTPGTGNDSAGYWAVNTTATNGWLRVTGVDDDRGEIEAVFVF